MAIRKLEKVYCSLNVGYVYSLNYSFEPQTGVRITLFFVNESGVYNTNVLSPKNKTTIRIGSAVFNMYPVKWERSQNGTQKTFKVDFIDETIRLKNYYISLTGKGCGNGVFQLGTVVDNRTDGEKEREDPDLFRIKAFTQDQDLEYSFSDFLNILRKIFTVKITLNVDQSLTRPFTGTLEDVLSAWCSYFNLSYFFENGSLVIFDPTTLNITFPSIPVDAIDSSESESIENTYDKTVWNNFYQDGGEINIGSTDVNDNIFISNESLFPWESLLDIKTLNDGIYGPIDTNQLAAAQYGKQFWFLYNYSKGTEKEICGFSRYQSFPADFSITNQKISNITDSMGEEKDVAFFDEDLFERNFSFYFNYGKNIAGRFYISKQKLGFGSFNLYNWYDQNTSTSVTIQELTNQPVVNAAFFSTPVSSNLGFIKETISNEFNGIALDGQRIYVEDNTDRNFDEVFTITPSIEQQVAGFYQKILGGDFGSGYIQWGDGTSKKYIIYEKINLSSEIVSLINDINKKTSIFNYRFKNFQMKGYFNAQISDETVNELFDNTDIQLTNQGPQVNSNISVIKAKKDSSYIAYYSKYNSCNSEYSNEGMLNRKFESIQSSIDIPIPITVTKNSRGVINIKRDLTFVNQYKNSGILKQFARPFIIPEKTLSFSLNYFYDGIPTSFISNGLVGISMSIQENGMSTSYSYSNQMLRTPPSTQLIEQLERSMKSSWVRTYSPPRKKNL